VLGHTLHSIGMQAIRLFVCLALVIVPAAGVLSALRTRNGRLTAAAVCALIVSVTLAGFALHSNHVIATAPDAPPAIDSDAD
jgi:hypothetical protein